MSGALGFVTAGVQQYADSILIRPARRSIGPFTAQVTIEEQHYDKLEITEHPVEIGAKISDHAFMRPSEVTIRCGWSNSPSVSGLIDGLIGGIAATTAGFGSNTAQQVQDVYAKLLALQSGREPFDAYTGKRHYTNMLIESLAVTTDKQNETALMVTAHLKQVILVQTQTVTAPTPASAQTNAAATQPTINSGTKSLIPSTRYVP